jgi:uncharacterized protein YyaL (SSP411 family)
MTNRLINSHSLYLQKHAENPIDWWPWCEEALAKAKADDRPIFLSVGYSSCHWCTVMEGEAFSDDAIATYLNDHFVPIKVDREERPDIDSVYMQAVQAMTGQGGWPMNMFLTPGDQVPFYGGTYFPLEPRYGRPGFLQVLEGALRFYREQPEALNRQKQTLMSHLSQMIEVQPGETLTSEHLQQGAAIALQILARQTPGPNFPMIPYANLVAQAIAFLPEAGPVAQQRAMDLVLGGIYDHVGGGFHRYTVDPTWTVPHFEKMLYDNGQILEYLADGWAKGWCDPAIARALRGTVTWLQREMTAPAGYFYAAQDADNFATPTEIEPEEGQFYVWRSEELETLLTSAQQQALAMSFEIQASGNFEGAIVLQRQADGELSAEVEEALERLFQERYGEGLRPTGGHRPTTITTVPPARNNQEAKTHPWPGRIPPVTDTKMIVAWNSLMISGLARAAMVLSDSAMLTVAIAAANFIANQQWQDGQLHRLNYDGQVAVLAQSEDYALWIKACLEVHQACLALGLDSAPWLAEALKAQQAFDQFLAAPTGGYFSTGVAIAQDYGIQERSWQDNATPSANGIAIANLIRLWLLTDDPALWQRADQGLQSFTTAIAEHPELCPSLMVALDWFQHPRVIKAKLDHLPEIMATVASVPMMFRAMEDLPPGAVTSSRSEPFALLCQGTICLEPAMTLDQLQTQIDVCYSPTESD